MASLLEAAGAVGEARGPGNDKCKMENDEVLDGHGRVP